MPTFVDPDDEAAAPLPRSTAYQISLRSSEAEMVAIELAIERLQDRLNRLRDRLAVLHGRDDGLPLPIVRIPDILRAVSQATGISVIDIISVRRTRAVTMARFMAYWLARRLTARSLPGIGRLIGDRDHTTVLHGCRRIEQLRRERPQLQATLDALQQTLTPAASAALAEAPIEAAP